MRERRVIVYAVALLAVGMLLGVVLAALLDDEDGETTTADTGTTTSKAPSSASSTTSSPSTTSTTTSSSTSTTSSTTTTTTSTTTTAPLAGPPPLADATTGRLVGFPMGSPLEAVDAALVDRLGPPDSDSGWTTGCPLDGDPDLDERIVWWGELRVRFAREAGVETVGGWNYGDARPPASPPTGPLAADIVMPPGVAWGQSIAEVADALDLSLDGIEGVQDTFGLTWVYDGDDARWLAAAPDIDAAFTEVSWRAFDICE